MNKIKSIKCYLIAIYEMIRYGVFVPHIYRDYYNEKCDIFVSDCGYRKATSLYHTTGERLVKNARVIKSRCTCCGHEICGWVTEEEFEGIKQDLWYVGD